MISMQNTNYPAYVFATVNHGMTKNVVEELKNNPNIDLIAPVTGRFDLALRLKQNTPEQILQFVNQIKSFPGLIEAWTTPGQFDIVALWQARTSDEIVKSAFEKFPTLQGIARSETLLAPTPLFKQ